MGGSAKYRYGKKIQRLQEKYGTDYADKPEYWDEADKAWNDWRKQERDAQIRAEERQGPYRESYPQDRLDNAIWTDNPSFIDATFRPESGRWWNELDSEEKGSVYSYTGSSASLINSYLGGNNASDRTKRKAELLTAALEKASIPEDIWVRRGVSDSHIRRLLGIDPSISVKSEGFREAVQKLIDDGTIKDNANFMSCGSTESTGFGGNVEMRIFVPKGTKGAYIEPVSICGNGAGLDWDGKSEQSIFSNELEILLQRGMKVKPIQYNKGAGRGGVDQIVFVIVGQETKPIS